MNQFDAEVEYLIGKSIRRGTVTWGEIATVREKLGDFATDVVTQTLHEAGVHFVKGRPASVTPKTNVLLNGLRLVELVSLSLQLPVAPRVRRRLHEHVLKRRSYELDLKRLEYLDSDVEWYYLSPSFNSLQRNIRRLFKSGKIPFSREWDTGEMKTNLHYVKALVAHFEFSNTVLPEIREHYLQLNAVQIFIGWVGATGRQIPTMADIIRAGLEQDGIGMVRGLLLSEKPSTAQRVLERRRDVCFDCPPRRRCAPLDGITDEYSVLMDYRASSLDSLIDSKYPDRDLSDCLVQDWLIAKMFLPYSIVVKTKRWMLHTDIIDVHSMILDKSHGQYCPCDDIWSLNSPYLRG